MPKATQSKLYSLNTGINSGYTGAAKANRIIKTTGCSIKKSK